MPLRSSQQVLGQVARNAALRRVVSSYALFSVCEYALWIAMLVYAYDQGGATAAGVVAIAQLLPAAAAAPLLATLADRGSPLAVLLGGYLVQALAAAGTAGLIFTGAPPVLAYAGAVVASTAMAATRPAQAALVPALSRETSELTAANVVLGWVESLSILAAGLVTGLALALGSVGLVFSAAAVLLAGAALLLVPLRTLPVSRRGLSTEAGSESPERSLVVLWRAPTARLLVGLLGAEHVVIGALDVLFVVLALDLLHAGQPWVGYLNTAYGAGSLLLGALGAFLVGRRLGPVLVLTALVLGVSVAGAAFTQLAGVVLLLGLAGGCRALFDVAVRVLLQRSVATHLLARIFGLAEALTMLGLAVGSALAPALIALGGARLALVGVGAVLPAVVLARARTLARIDQHARVPVVEISLLRQLPIFRMLPPDEIEGLAQAVEQVSFDPGSEIVREGEKGECYYAIVDGAVEIRQSGRPIATLERGSGFGEIALLRAVPRTASAVASTPVTAMRLDRESFLTAVNGHVPTLESALQVVSDHEARDADRDPPP